MHTAGRLHAVHFRLYADERGENQAPGSGVHRAWPGNDTGAAPAHPGGEEGISLPDYLHGQREPVHMRRIRRTGDRRLQHRRG